MPSSCPGCLKNAPQVSGGVQVSGGIQVSGVVVQVSGVVVQVSGVVLVSGVGLVSGVVLVSGVGLVSGVFVQFQLKILVYAFLLHLRPFSFFLFFFFKQKTAYEIGVRLVGFGDVYKRQHPNRYQYPPCAINILPVKSISSL